MYGFLVPLRYLQTCIESIDHMQKIIIEWQHISFHSTNHIFKYVMLRPSIMYINTLDGSFLSFHSILFIYLHH
jgi:hypothetical protein